MRQVPRIAVQGRLRADPVDQVDLAKLAAGHQVADILELGVKGPGKATEISLSCACAWAISVCASAVLITIGLLDQHMAAGADRVHGLLKMIGVRADDHHAVERHLRQHRLVVVEGGRRAAVGKDLGHKTRQVGLAWVDQRGDLGIRHLLRKHPTVVAGHPASADKADPYPFRQKLLLCRQYRFTTTRGLPTLGGRGSIRAGSYRRIHPHAAPLQQARMQIDAVQSKTRARAYRNPTSISAAVRTARHDRLHQSPVRKP